MMAVMLFAILMNSAHCRNYFDAVLLYTYTDCDIHGPWGHLFMRDAVLACRLAL